MYRYGAQIPLFKARAIQTALLASHWLELTWSVSELVATITRFSQRPRWLALLRRKAAGTCHQVHTHGAIEQGGPHLRTQGRGGRAKGPA